MPQPFDSNEERLKELDRLKKELGKMEPHMRRLEKKLANENFINNNATAEILPLKKKLQDILERRRRIRDTIDDLS